MGSEAPVRKAQRRNSSSEREDLRGEIRRLRKALAQAQRQIQRLQGIHAWGWLEEEQETSAQASPVVSDAPTQSGTSSMLCAHCAISMILILKPDGTGFYKCSTCLRKVKK